MTTTPQLPICYWCKHLKPRNPDRSVRDPYSCAAFSNKIPDEILDSEFDHRFPHPEDNGIQFAKYESMDSPEDFVKNWENTVGIDQALAAMFRYLEISRKNGK